MQVMSLEERVLDLSAELLEAELDAERVRSLARCHIPTVLSLLSAAAAYRQLLFARSLPAGGSHT